MTLKLGRIFRLFSKLGGRSRRSCAGGANAGIIASKLHAVGILLIPDELFQANIFSERNVDEPLTPL